MKTRHNLMLGVLIVSVVLLFLAQIRIAFAQNLQQLSYANADIAQVLIRPHLVATTTEQPAIVTTSKPGFFSGIRNFFSRNSSPSTLDAATLSTTTPRPVHWQPPTPTTNGRPLSAPAVIPSVPYPPYNQNASNVGVILHSSAQNSLPRPQQPLGPHGSPPTAAPRNIFPPTPAPRNHQSPQIYPFPPLPAPRSPSSLPAATPRDEFPPLGPPRRPPSPADSIPASPSNPDPPPSNVWSRPGTTNGQQLPIIPAIPMLNPSYNPVGSTKFPELATPAEIEELTEKLLSKSTPNILPYITVNLQGMTRSSSTADEAPLPLLTVNETVLTATPTLIKMQLLFNNYEIETTVNEYVSPTERDEENDFLEAVLATPVMRTAMLFLQERGIVTADPRTHFDMLRTIWFNNYSRGRGKIGSSAFEHVFLNEIKNYTAVSGLHNWVWYYYKEGQSGQTHSIDYKGYMNSVLLGNKGQVVKYRFSYNNISKPVNAMFIGTLPELDMAVYTVCFQLMPNKECPVSLGGTKFIIRTHTFKYRGKRLIGSAFPEI